MKEKQFENTADWKV